MQRDPRIDALEELFGKGGGPVRPGMKTEEDLRQFEEQNVPRGQRQPENFDPNSEDSMRERATADAVKRYMAQEGYSDQDVMESFGAGGEQAEAFINNFGLEPHLRLERQLGLSREDDPHETIEKQKQFDMSGLTPYTPMPRPRYPDLKYSSEHGQEQMDPPDMIEQGATFRKQDAERLRDPKKWQERNPGTEFGYSSEGEEGYITDEDIQEMIQKGLVPKDMGRAKRRRGR